MNLNVFSLFFWDSILIFIFIYILIAIIYLLPTILWIISKKRTLTPIILLNIFTGWTIVWWFLALLLCSLEDNQYYYECKCNKEKNEAYSNVKKIDKTFNKKKINNF